MQLRCTFRCQLAVAVLLMLCLVCAPAGAQDCGDLDNTGDVAFGDLTMLIDHLYMSLTPLAFPENADMDEVPGVTNNDLLTLVDHLYVSLRPLNCDVIPGASFPYETDILEPRNLNIPAGETHWDAEVWLNATSPFDGVCIILEYQSEEPSLVLDSVSIDLTPLAGDTGRVHPTLPRAAIGTANLGSAYPAGDQKIATMHFSLDAQTEDVTITLDTCSFPPTENTTVVSRFNGEGRLIGTVPMMENDFVCGNVDNDPGGNISTSDISYIVSYLFQGGTLPRPEAANVDAMCGVNGHDFLLLTDCLFVTLHDLPGCTPVTDSLFPACADVIDFQNMIIPPGMSACTVSVFVRKSAPFEKIFVPFTWSADDPSVDLVGYPLSGGGTVHPTEPYGVIALNDTSLIPTGTSIMLAGQIEFSCTPSATPITISIDTSGYPGTDHQLVLSRYDDTGYLVGQKPALGSLDFCMATGDINGSGGPEITDVADLIDILCVNQNAPPSFYVADVNGDCVVDTLDVRDLACAIFHGCENEPQLPAFTCCDPAVVYCGQDDQAVAVGGATIEVDSTGERPKYTVYVDDVGNKGIKHYPKRAGETDGEKIEFENVELSKSQAEFIVEFTGTIVDTTAKEEYLGDIGLCGISHQLGFDGALQIIADFNPIGDPNVFVQVYNSGILTGQATIPGGGVIAWAGDPVNGFPWIRGMQLHALSPAAFIIELDQYCQIELFTGATLFGDEIRLTAANATLPVTGLYSSTTTASYIGWFAASYESDVCCRGFTGNVDYDAADVVSLSDLTKLIDNLYISLAPVACEEEADMDGSYDGVISLADLSRLIDVLFISLSPPPPCP